MANNIHFKDRLDAARQLTLVLQKFAKEKTVIFALPRGGVPMGKEIAREMNCPLDIVIVRKIGHPTNPEYAIGVISEDGHTVLNEEELRTVEPKWFREESEKQKAEAKRRRELYLKNRTPVDVAGKIAIIVDDGIATGLTMLGAIKEIKHKNPAKVVVAVPVSPKETAEIIKKEVDEFITLSIPDFYLGAVGAYYDDFPQVSDEEVIALLEPKPKTLNIEQNINIAIDSLNLPGILVLPKSAKGLVIFAHGGGSSRFSPRNVFVSKVIQKAGMGTLLFDLLTEKEDEIYENRFDITLIADRLIKATRWLLKKDDTKNLVMGFFGASTGAAAALKAAAALPMKIKAVVSRGGRPDLAMEDLPKVKAPTLLIVGGADDVVIELNKAAYSQLNCVKQLVIVPGATHLFEEPGTLEEVAKLANEWFVKYLM